MSVFFTLIFLFENLNSLIHLPSFRKSRMYLRNPLIWLNFQSSESFDSRYSFTVSRLIIPLECEWKDLIIDLWLSIVPLPMFSPSCAYCVYSEIFPSKSVIIISRSSTIFRWFLIWDISDCNLSSFLSIEMIHLLPVQSLWFRRDVCVQVTF